MSDQDEEPSPSPLGVPLVWTACVPIVTAFLTGVIYSFFPQLWILCLAAGFIVVPVWVLIVLVRIGVATWRRMWRKSALLLGILVGVWPLMAVAIFAGDYVHLFALYPGYKSKIDTRSTQSLAPITFGWGGSGFAGTGKERFLVYDATGEGAYKTVGQELASETQGWTTADHLIGNFYVVEVGW